MSNPTSPAKRAEMQTHPPSLLAGLLSYLVPGLGQVYQGRVGKGLLFLFSIYGLFFLGMYLGSGQVEADGQVHRITGNVYLPHTAQRNNPWQLRWAVAADLYNRPQFLAQFWVGIAAWPAIWQYAKYEEEKPAGPVFGTFMREPKETTVNLLQTAGDKKWDLGWVYTVIAGVLNIMIIYDAYAGPAFGAGPERSRDKEPRAATPSPATGA